MMRQATMDDSDSSYGIPLHWKISQMSLTIFKQWWRPRLSNSWHGQTRSLKRRQDVYISSVVRRMREASFCFSKRQPIDLNGTIISSFILFFILYYAMYLCSGVDCWHERRRSIVHGRWRVSSVIKMRNWSTKRFNSFSMKLWRGATRRMLTFFKIGLVRDRVWCSG